MIKNALIWAGKRYTKNPSAFLNGTAAASFALLCLGEALMISKNENIPEDQRRYLVPQSLAEGATNVAVILGVSTALKNIGTSLIKKAVIVPGNIPKVLKNSEALSQILKAPEFTQKLAAGVKGLNKSTFNKVKSFQVGMETLTGPILGLFVAQNLLIPVISNKVAKWARNKYAPKGNSLVEESNNPVVKPSEIKGNKDLVTTFSATQPTHNPFEANPINSPYNRFAKRPTYYNNSQGLCSIVRL